MLSVIAGTESNVDPWQFAASQVSIQFRSEDNRSQPWKFVELNKVSNFSIKPLDWLSPATCWCASGLLSVSSQSGSWTSFWVCCPQRTWDGMHTDTPKTHRIQIQKTLDPHRLPKSKVIGHHHHFPSKQPQLQSLLLVKEPKEIDGLAKQAQRLMGIHDMTLHWVRWTDSSVNWSVLTSHLLCWPHSGKQWAQSSHGLMNDSFTVTFHWQLTTGVYKLSSHCSRFSKPAQPRIDTAADCPPVAMHSKGKRFRFKLNCLRLNPSGEFLSLLFNICSWSKWLTDANCAAWVLQSSRAMEYNWLIWQTAGCINL